MTIAPDAVRWAYRLLLDREPESETVVQNYTETRDVPTLRHIFLNSDEFRAKNGDDQRIGRHTEVTSIPVQVEASEAEIGTMMERIAREWRKFGETEPHWSVLTSEQFTAADIADNIDLFYQSGTGDLKFLLNPLTRAGLSAAHFGKVLDFGCGVGRLSLTLAPYADQVLGVDISPPHIRLAQERAAQVGAVNVDFQSIDKPADLDRLSGFDLIVSLIVLQHNPPPVMATLLEKLLRALAPGGAAVIQMPTFLRDYRFSVADYLANTQPPMEMNALPQPAIFEIAGRAGCRVLEVREDHCLGTLAGISQTFAFRREG